MPSAGGASLADGPAPVGEVLAMTMVIAAIADDLEVIGQAVSNILSSPGNTPFGHGLGGTSPATPPEEPDDIGENESKLVTFRNNRPNDMVQPVSRRVLVEVNGKWKTVGPGGTRTAKGSFDFVTINGKTYVAPKDAGHINISGGRPVHYAGTVRFNKKGQLTRWDNNSGHYQPTRGAAQQARLPLDKFKPID